MPRIVVNHTWAVEDALATMRSIARTVSVPSAVKWRKQIDTAIRNLATDADQWPEANEAATLGFDLRCRLVGRRRHVYRVLFTIDGSTVNVLRIRHAAMDQITEADF